MGLERVVETAEEADMVVEKVVTNAATKTMGGGGFASIVGWVASSEGIAVIGLLVTLLGFGVNLFFRIRRDRREQQISDAKLALLEHKHQEEHVRSVTDDEAA